MKKLLLVLLLFPTISIAQEQPKFTPYIVSQEEHTKIFNYLGEQPAKFSIPLMQALSALEQKAVEEAKKKDEKK